MGPGLTEKLGPTFQMLCLSALPPPRSFLLLPSSTDLRVHTLGLHVLFWNSTCVLLRLLLLLLLVLLRPSKVPAARGSRTIAGIAKDRPGPALTQKCHCKPFGHTYFQA